MPTRIISKQLGGFPDRYFCRLKATGAFTPSAATSHYITWIGNSLMKSGVSVNGGSITAANTAGAKYLLGLPGAPASAPYAAYRIWGSSIKIKSSQATSTLTAQQLDYVLNPSLSAASEPSDAGYGTSTLSVTADQPFAKTKSMVVNNTGKPLFFKQFISLRRIFGIKYKAAIEGDNNFVAATLVEATPFYWNLHIYGDGSTNISPRVEFEIVYYVEFFERTNLLSTAAPS